MKAANELLEGLASEEKSWDVRAKKLELDAATILGDTILSAGIIAYLGALPKDFREELVASWNKMIKDANIEIDQEFALKKVCSDDLTIGNWVDKFSLPNDSISIDNAIIMEKSGRYPLIIDPQEQAFRYIKKLYAKKNIDPKSATEDPGRLSMYITEAIQGGYPVLIGDVGETIGTMLESILDKDIASVGGITKIRFMDKLVNYNPDFKIFLTTKLSNPHYPPETCAKVTLLNF